MPDPVEEGDAAPVAHGWDAVELLEEYARLNAERLAIERKLDQLKGALVEVARAEDLEEVRCKGGSMKFKRWRGLNVVAKDVVLEVLERRRLLAEFAVVRTEKLYALASEFPDLRDELGESVEEVENFTPRFAPARK